MARKFAEFSDSDESGTPEAVIDSPTITINDDMVNARVKGTWKMFWGRSSYDFVDGQRYRLPRDLFSYLKKNGNIYDTMA